MYLNLVRPIDKSAACESFEKETWQSPVGNRYKEGYSRHFDGSQPSRRLTL